jgi:hypothetical protein
MAFVHSLQASGVYAAKRFDLEEMENCGQGGQGGEEIKNWTRSARIFGQGRHKINRE